METLHMITEAFQKVLDKLEHIDRRLDKDTTKQLSETWLDIQETCEFLKISKRSLQNYRDNGILPFSQIGGKIYFKVFDLEEHLRRHYVKKVNKHRRAA
jgi:MerR family transcriptional regulator, repressor of the yfmOP operon